MKDLLFHLFQIYGLRVRNPLERWNERRAKQNIIITGPANGCHIRGKKAQSI